MSISYDRLLSILHEYIDNDLDGSSASYVSEVLSELASDEEIDELGYGWLLEYKEEDDEEEEE